jgi:hypothetical protein
VIVILVSAFERLMLYESAYGFSRLRTYTHIFIPWLGLLLVVTAALIVFGKSRAFALAAILCIFGFGLSLNMLDVDAFITRQNIQFTANGHDLDIPYLAYLSDDSVPTLVTGIQDTNLAPSERQELTAALKCRLEAAGATPAQPAAWQSANLSTIQATAAIREVQSRLDTFQVIQNHDSSRQVKSGSMTWNCY